MKKEIEWLRNEKLFITCDFVELKFVENIGPNIIVKVIFDNYFGLCNALKNFSGDNVTILDCDIRGCHPYMVRNSLLMLTFKDSYFDKVSKSLVSYFSKKENLDEIKGITNLSDLLDKLGSIVHTKLGFRNYAVVKPNYSDTFLNVISSIKANYNTSFTYPKDLYVSKLLESHHYRHIGFLILDGLGTKILESNLPESAFLRHHYIRDMVSIYPCTTAASTTAAKSGLAPVESGWTGWENYIREINKNLVLFLGNDTKTNEYLGVSGKTYLPYKKYFEDFKVDAKSITPGYDENGYKTFREIINKFVKNSNLKRETFNYLYWAEPDSNMHMTGTNSNSTRNIILDLNKIIENAYSRMGEDTLLIITADHGHVNCKGVDFFLVDELTEMLERMPSNDARCVTFKVKPECYLDFPKVFHKYYHNYYELYKSEDFIKSNYLGDLNYSKINPRVYDFMGDYVGVGISDVYLKYHALMSDFASHHSGMTEDEMLVPLIILRK